MRAIQIMKAGAPEQLRLQEMPLPEPAAGQVQISVRAAGINFADILARQGIYPDCPPYPCVVGYEVAGVVTDVGAGVDADWIGREVLALTDFGGYAEYSCVDVRYVWAKPPALSFAEAAAIPLNGVTAWALLVAMGGLQPEDTVLIHNAGGGVGLAALDIARHIGARTIGTASARKHDFLRERGCDECVDYRASDWPAQIMALTEDRGVELAIDPIGGPHWHRTACVLSKTGRMGVFGISGASAPGWRGKLNLVGMFLRTRPVHPVRLIRGNQGVFGVNIHAMYGEHARFDRWMRALLAGVEAGWYRPHVDQVFRFDQAAAAHAHVEARNSIGKVVLAP